MKQLILIAITFCTFDPLAGISYFDAAEAWHGPTHKYFILNNMPDTHILDRLLRERIPADSPEWDSDYGPNIFLQGIKL